MFGSALWLGIGSRRHKPRSVPVALLVARELQFAGVELTCPREYIRTLRCCHRCSVTKIPSVGCGVAHKVNHLVGIEFLHHHAFLARTDVNAYLISLAGLAVLQIPLVVGVETRYEFHALVCVRSVCLCGFIHVLP